MPRKSRPVAQDLVPNPFKVPRTRKDKRLKENKKVDGRTGKIESFAQYVDPETEGFPLLNPYQEPRVKSLIQRPKEEGGPFRGCCATLRRDLRGVCDIHANPADCPDRLVVFSKNRWGLYIHDGGGSSIPIMFCPWCGTELATLTAPKPKKKEDPNRKR